MLARVARYEVGRDRVEDAADAFGQAAAEIEQLDGFMGGYVLVDYEDGRAMTVTLWRSQAALDASEPSARAARNRAAESVEGSVLSVEKLDVAQELRSSSGS